jgi:hypothetical protein
MKNWLLHYLYGLTASVWKGLISSAYVSFGASGANTVGLVDLHDIKLGGFLSIIAGTIVYHAVVYFYTHPVPDELPTLRAAIIASSPKTNAGVPVDLPVIPSPGGVELMPAASIPLVTPLPVVTLTESKVTIEHT